MVALTKPPAPPPGAAPSKIRLSVPVPSGLIAIDPLEASGVVMVSACPSIAKVPLVDCILGEAAAKTICPRLFITGTVLAVAEELAG
ncbi:MAG: hypothetical protein ACD_13C00031G0003 [uncultured bacterium]|nr:MAG: hypothetical protein ACD_13C00031G0003 [uncultured bacterium]